MDVVAVQRETIPSRASIKDGHKKFWGQQWKGKFIPQWDLNDQQFI